MNQNSAFSSFSSFSNGFPRSGPGILRFLRFCLDIPEVDQKLCVFFCVLWISLEWTNNSAFSSLSSFSNGFSRSAPVNLRFLRFLKDIPEVDQTICIFLSLMDLQKWTKNSAFSSFSSFSNGFPRSGPGILRFLRFFWISQKWTKNSVFSSFSYGSLEVNQKFCVFFVFFFF